MPTSFSASVLLSTNALAACSPAAATGVTAVCTGATSTTYGTGIENDVTLTVENGATVTGTNFADEGVKLGAGASINNFGTILSSVSGNAVEATGITSLTNSGTIDGDGMGVFSQSISTLTNKSSGIIESDSEGIKVDGDIGSLFNYGTITSLRDGIQTDRGDILSLVNYGTIESRAQRGISVDGNIESLVNSGKIQAISSTGSSDGIRAVVTGASLTRALEPYWA